MKDKLQIVLGILALIGVGIAIGAVLVLVFISLGARPTKIGVGPVDWEIPTSQPQTPVVLTQSPTSTSEPQGSHLESLGTIRVFGNSKQGVQIQISRTGIYRFAYRSGAYSTYPVNSAPPDTKTWLTAILIFLGDRAPWDEDRIRDEEAFLRLADTNYRASSEEAEESARGQYVEAQLNEGDVLTFMAVDRLNAYADNPGQVIVEWLFVNY